MTKTACTLVATGLILSMLLAACASATQSPAPTTSTAPTSSVPTTAAPKPTPTPTPSASATPQYGGILNVIEPTIGGGPLGAEWEPAGDQEAEQYFMQRMIEEQFDGSIGPLLATSFDPVTDPNNASITFHLRQGVKFQDGSDWNAQVFAWNVDIFTNPGKYVPGDNPAYRSTTDYWKSVDIIDNYTARVNYPMWRNSFPRSWENYFMASKLAFDTNGNTWMRTHIVGTGPFKFGDYVRDVSITGTKFDGFYIPGRPYLDGVKLTYVTDPLTQVAVMKTGDGDVLNAGAQVASQQFQSQGWGGSILSRSGGPYVFAPDSRNADSPWANLKVRQALSYAIDRVALAKTFSYGYGAGAAYQITDPTSKAYDPNLAVIPYDPAKAKQLLSDAGYPNGFKTRIIAPPQALNKDAVVALQSQMAAVGITADLQFPTAAQFAAINGPTTVMSPSNALIYENQAVYSNVNTTLNVYYADPGAFGLYSLKKPDGWPDLYAKSLTSPLPDQTILRQVSDAFYNDSTVIPTYYGASVAVLSPKLHDSGLNKVGTFFRWDLPNTWKSQ